MRPLGLIVWLWLVIAMAGGTSLAHSPQSRTAGVSDIAHSIELLTAPDRKEEDPAGLLNEGFRYRDLETGSFITRDPAGFVDGPNLYTYVRQNPWTSFDPEGLFLKEMMPTWAQPAFAPGSTLGSFDRGLDTAIEAKNVYSQGRQTGDGVGASALRASGMYVARMTGAMDWAEAVNGSKIVNDKQGTLSTAEMGPTEIAVKAVTGASGMVLTGVAGASLLPKSAATTTVESQQMVAEVSDVAAADNAGRVRHYTSPEGLAGIKADGALNPARGGGVHVETGPPFWPGQNRGGRDWRVWEGSLCRI